ncbi:MAG: hypothetical protein ABR527_10490 [Gemmatimonadota bacterium]
MNAPCGRARRLLWPDKGPHAASQETEAAWRHVEACADCRVFLEDMKSLCEAVGGALKDETAPIDIREAIYARLAAERERQRSRRWVRRFALAIVLAIVLGGAAIVLREPSPRAAIEPLLAAEHANRLGGDRLSSEEPREIEAWLAARLDFAVQVPTLTGARLTGARIGVTEAGRGAILEYAVGDRAMSYFVLPQTREDLPIAPALRSVTERGYRIVLWQDMGLMHAMVGAIAHEELARLAHECMEQMRNVALLIASPPMPTA